MKACLFVIALLILPTFAQSGDVIRVEVGKDYSRYSKKELRRRVWHLERAVAQLQDQVFHLAMNQGQGSIRGNTWNCHIQAFGKTSISSGESRASALAKVLKECSDEHGAIFCKEKDVKCDNK